MMRLLGTLAILVIPLAACAAPTQIPMAGPGGLPEMFGGWIVSKVLCDECGGSAAPELGTRIFIGPGAFKDPFSTNCAVGATYPHRRLAWTDALSLFALPKDAREFAPASGTVTDARLDCGGGPYARVLFLGGNQAIYLYEAEDYVILRETPR